MLEDKSLNLQGRMSNTYLISPKTSKVNICIDWFSFTADQQVRTNRNESDIQAILRLITPILNILKVEPNSYTKGIGKAFYKYPRFVSPCTARGIVARRGTSCP